MIYILIPIGIASVIYLVRKWREMTWGWVRNKYSLQQKLFIITGANTGLGYETAKALAARDATVIMACRNVLKANDAVLAIRKETTKGHLIIEELDLASFESIKTFASTIKAKYSNFYCLINNAGLATKNNEVTKDNFEIHFGVNHLGHFLLFNLLQDLIRENQSKIVIVSSQLHRRGVIDFENMAKCPLTPQTGRMNKLYSNSKLANFYFARELYKREFDVHVLCPGLCYTDFFRNYNPKWYHFIIFAPIVLLMLRSAKQGAQNIIYCATDNKHTETKNPLTCYLVINLKQTKSKFTFQDAISERLWSESLKYCENTLKTVN